MNKQKFPIVRMFQAIKNSKLSVHIMDMITDAAKIYKEDEYAKVPLLVLGSCALVGAACSPYQLIELSIKFVSQNYWGMAEHSMKLFMASSMLVISHEFLKQAIDDYKSPRDDRNNPRPTNPKPSSGGPTEKPDLYQLLNMQWAKKSVKTKELT